MTGPDTVSCVTCHTSSVLLDAHARTAGVDPATLQSRYATTRDVSISAGKAGTSTRTIRALGYLNREPFISQRVANDTAQVLAEIDQRFR